MVPPAARAAVTHAARAGTASGLNDVLLAAAAFAALGAIAGFAYGPDPASQPPSPAPGDHSAQAAQPATAQHQAQRPAGPKQRHHSPIKTSAQTRRLAPSEHPGASTPADWVQIPHSNRLRRTETTGS